MRSKRTILGAGMSAAALAADTEQSDIEYIAERQRKARARAAAAVPARKTYDYVGAIMAYEQGDLSDTQTLELFDYLLKSGVIYGLQGSYQRMAQSLIDAGEISR